MHIAVCDDNVADRKQLERLLKREADKRSCGGEILYTDSFGNAQALLSNPMQYDAFYIDMCYTENMTGVDVVNNLTAQGVKTPIIMCCSLINYKETELPSNVFFLDKPIKTAELSTSIDHALSIKSQILPLIELREEKDTFYVTEPEIAYAQENKKNFLAVTLTDGRIINVATTALNFFSQIEKYTSFFAPSVKLVINGRHIEKIGFRTLQMADGKVFRISGKCMTYAKYAQNEYHGKLK